MISGGMLRLRDVKRDFTGNLFLDEAWDVAFAELDGETFAYVTGARDPGIQIFRMDGLGNLTAAGQVADSPALSLSFATTMRVASVGDAQFLVVVSEVENAVSVFRIGTGASAGQLTLTDTETNSAIGGLGGARYVETCEVDGRTFVITSALNSDALRVFQLRADGTLLQRSITTDTAALQLDGVGDIATATVGANTFLYSAGLSGDDISAFRVGTNGALVNVQNIDLAGFANLASVVTATAGASSYAIFSDNTADRLLVYRILANGTLTALPDFTGPNETSRDVTGLTSFTVDGETFLAGASSGNNSLILYHLAANGTITALQRMQDTAQAGLDGAHEVEHREIGGRHFLAVTGRVDDAVTTYEIGADAETIAGGAENDFLFGFSANDVLSGDAGNDRLFGGIGDDSLIGGTDNDTLIGGDGNDTIAGEDGNDRVFGGTGVDRAFGGKGSDTLEGGDGNDRLFGSSGSDTLDGGNGSDTLEGGSGDDLLTGGANADSFVFRTNSGEDRIADFTGADVIVLTGLGFASFAAVMNATAQQPGGALITLSPGNAILVEGFQKSAFVADDFVL